MERQALSFLKQKGARPVDSPLFSEAVEEALKQIISHLDYDLHKYIEVPEDGGDDGYPTLTARFINAYQHWVKDLELT